MSYEYNKKLIEDPDLSETPSLEVQLAHALRTVLEWPNPNGKIQDYYIPGWLSRKARDALERFCSDYEATHD